MNDGCDNLCRRKFCVAAGAGLLAMGLPACDPGAGRLGEGVIDDGTGAGGGTGTGGNGQTKPDMAQQPQPPSQDMAGQPPADLAGQPPGNDMAQAPSCTPGTVNAGAASSYVVGTPKGFTSGSKPLFVVRDAGGLYAVTAVCTHSGCTNQVKNGVFYCPCHGATFDFNGDNPKLPAVTPLKHYALCIDASGNVTVDPSKTVPSNTRA